MAAVNSRTVSSSRSRQLRRGSAAILCGSKVYHRFLKPLRAVFELAQPKVALATEPTPEEPCGAIVVALERVRMLATDGARTRYALPRRIDNSPALALNAAHSVRVVLSPSSHVRCFARTLGLGSLHQPSSFTVQPRERSSATSSSVLASWTSLNAGDAAVTDGGTEVAVVVPGDDCTAGAPVAAAARAASISAFVLRLRRLSSTAGVLGKGATGAAVARAVDSTAAGAAFGASTSGVLWVSKTFTASGGLTWTGACGSALAAL